MPRQKKPSKKPIEQYDHSYKERANNPPVGLVTPETDKDKGKKTYTYDPHLDPQLQWAGKAERTSFDVPTVSLHVHERIDPRTIIEAVRKQNREQGQLSLFESAGENPPLREAIEFYKHPHGWSNRIIAGDSLLVMNSLLEKEGMAGQIQMIYIDPPYGVKYGSNFQPFVNKREVKDGKDADLTAEPEMIKAFRDTWELGIHSYLTYLRDRLLLSQELLSDSGSVFVQTSDENVHHVRELMDEIFGVSNFCALLAFLKTSGFTTELLSRPYDYLLWFAKDKEKIKYRRLWQPRKERTEGGTYNCIQIADGSWRRLTSAELNEDTPGPEGHRFRADTIVSPGATSTGSEPIEFEGKEYYPSPNSHWKTTADGMNKLIEEGRVVSVGKILAYKRFEDDFPFMPFTSVWDDTVIGTYTPKLFVVQTSEITIQRCMLMTTDPSDLVLDPTCGSGTTAYVAEQWGRRWITCDTSRVAISIAKQRLMTSLYAYYELAYPDDGVGSGFRYQTVPHITLKSIASKEPVTEETLYDQPYIDNTKVRVSGPFTVEAVPAPVVRPASSVGELDLTPGEGITSEALEMGDDSSIARSGETVRQAEWRDELLKAGIRAKNNQFVKFSRVEPLPGTRWLHADAETTTAESGTEQVAEAVEPYAGQVRAVLSFGPEHAPLEQRQVALAIEEAQKLVPKPKLVVFAAFQFDPEAAKDIDETEWPGVALLRVQMNADLLTDDLKKKRSSNESFWLMGQPDVSVEKIADGEHAGKYRVEVHGFDYYNAVTGVVDSGGSEKITMWMLDTDYDGRSLFPRQVFFPMAGDKEGWARLAKSLTAEIDEQLIEAYRGTVSLLFERGDNGRIAVKIVDDRGIESLKIINLD